MLLEPCYLTEVLCAEEHAPRVRAMLQKRRATMLRKSPVPGSPFSRLQFRIPVVDSFGVDVDVRLATQGRGFAMSHFERFEEVPGDPLDASLLIPPLKPAPNDRLARDFLVKTRTRKGLDPAWSINAFLDPTQIISFQST